MIIFDKMETGNGKIIFWGSLYSITNLQINKMKKIVNLSFYDNDTTNEYDLQLKVENILFFRDTLVKKMGSLKVKSESTKLIKGQKVVRRLTTKEIELIDIDHDAGIFAKFGGDYIKLLDWLEETGRNYPIKIHSMNPVGVKNMKAICYANNWKVEE